MSHKEFIQHIKSGLPVSFACTMKIITNYYHYQPVSFTNGLGTGALTNAAGSNEGSCKIFAFAQLNQLNETQTLNLFGEYYRNDVLSDPEGTGHQNIRNFMKFGWPGISFSAPALTKKSCYNTVQS
jgi:hypothetical protein